jgi:isopenicillin N synthase-like dioxygenase
VDATGQPDTPEFINIAKDDALAYPEQARRAYPSTVNAHMSKTVTPFVKKSIEVNDTLLQIFNDRLGLPPDALKKRHTLAEYSGSETRVIKTPPSPDVPLKVAIGAHTDFGTLSFLHNRLGGLQVLVPGSEDWQYIKVYCLGLFGCLRSYFLSRFRDTRSVTSETHWRCSVVVSFDLIFTVSCKCFLSI